MATRPTLIKRKEDMSDISSIGKYFDPGMTTMGQGAEGVFGGDYGALKGMQDYQAGLKGQLYDESGGLKQITGVDAAGQAAQDAASLAQEKSFQDLTSSQAGMFSNLQSKAEATGTGNQQSANQLARTMARGGAAGASDIAASGAQTQADIAAGNIGQQVQNQQALQTQYGQGMSNLADISRTGANIGQGQAGLGKGMVDMQSNLIGGNVAGQNRQNQAIYAQQLAEEAAAKKKKGGMWSTIGTMAGGAIGSMYGQPQLGASLGGMAGGMLA